MNSDSDLVIKFKKGKSKTYKKEKYFAYLLAGSYIVISRKSRADQVEIISRTVIPLSDVTEIMEIKTDDGAA